MRYVIIAEKRGDLLSRIVGRCAVLSSANMRYSFAAYVAREYPRHVVYLERVQ
jgi:hypothetical protein